MWMTCARGGRELELKTTMVIDKLAHHSAPLYFSNFFLIHYLRALDVSPVDLVRLIPVVAIATIKFYQASCNLWRGETAVDVVNASASAPTLRNLPSNEGYTAGISAKVP